MGSGKFHVRYVRARRQNHAKNALEQGWSHVIVVMAMDESLAVAATAREKRFAHYVTRERLKKQGG